MNYPQGSKIALGLITRELIDPAPIQRFIDNAEAYGHRIDRVIVSYSHRFNDRVIVDLQQQVSTDVLCVHEAPSLARQLLSIGLNSAEVEGLIGVPSWSHFQEVPYGAYRNVILLHALLQDMDYLIFFDSDVEPRVLTGIEGGSAAWEDIDFVGTHKVELAREEVVATTSEYSGYYIIPPMGFEGFSDLLYGLGKSMALEYMEDCQAHQCLNLGTTYPREIKPTHKPLGGNLGLSLDRFWLLAPFFSTTYQYNGMCIKGRGEDTLLGQALADCEGMIMDVDLRVFHDTYEGFPEIPDIQKSPIRDRFYQACLGWIGRNPFLTWFLDRCGRLETSFEAEVASQRLGLRVGGMAAAENLQDARFSDLASAFECSYCELPVAIERFKQLITGWSALINNLRSGQPSIKAIKRFDRWLPLAS